MEIFFEAYSTLMKQVKLGVMDWHYALLTGSQQQVDNTTAFKSFIFSRHFICPVMAMDGAWERPTGDGLELTLALTRWGGKKRMK
jgi:hypothetical protein